uniref:Methyltransferase type 11 n=1 Tax=uncultured microorganism TaxID=358574 RepID=F8UHR0_9ZZZZ|nr:methyltransferase type 11 [uncultured microorganism]
MPSGRIKNSDLHFYLHVCFFKLRDFLFPRADTLKEAQIKSGFHVLDYGCGPGSYILSLAQIVGDTGKVYAVDIHPLAVKKINAIISKRRLKNVESICSDCKTGLPDNSIDVVLLYDALHALNNSNKVLEELHRVLKPGGILSLRDHRMRADEIVNKITKNAYFQFLKKSKKTYTFRK